MGVYQQRDKLGSVRNLTEAYRITFPKADRGIDPVEKTQIEVSQRVVQRELEHEALKRQVLPDVTRDIISLAALHEAGSRSILPKTLRAASTTAWGEYHSVRANS